MYNNNFIGYAPVIKKKNQKNCLEVPCTVFIEKEDFKFSANDF
jgi:hypothetical protein